MSREAQIIEPISSSKRKNRRKAIEQNDVLVEKPLKDIEYPQHLKNVNYLSLDAFEASSQDQITQNSYYQAIIENKHLFIHKIALHITQGSNCLYSIFAAHAGCDKVYCVVNSDSPGQQQNMIMMRQIVKQNDLQDIIEVLPWNKFNAEVDIIIGEPMGYCLHLDGLADRIIQARDLYLTKNGIIFPNLITFKCGLIHDEHFIDHKLNYWDSVYGIPMKTIKKWVYHQPLIRTVDPAMIVSKATKAFTFDLSKVTYQEVVNIDKIFEIQLLGPCKSNGIVFWFEAFFEHSLQKKDIKASPWVEETKYTQSTLYWPNLLEYCGGKLRIRLKGQRFPKEGYSIITTQIDNNTYQYSFS